MIAKVKTICTYCGKEIEKYPSQIREHNFCGKTCRMTWLWQTYNRPGHNQDRIFYPGMKRKPRKKVPERSVIVEAASLLLGRPLKHEEVVHHIDNDSFNNKPENLMVFPDTAAHSKWHADTDKAWGWKRGSPKKEAI